MTSQSNTHSNRHFFTIINPLLLRFVGCTRIEAYGRIRINLDRFVIKIIPISISIVKLQILRLFIIFSKLVKCHLNLDARITSLFIIIHSFSYRCHVQNKHIILRIQYIPFKCLLDNFLVFILIFILYTTAASII